MALGFVWLGAPGCFAAESAIRSVPDLVLREPQQDKDLHIRVSYPVSGKALPVILFSHGFSNSKDGYRPLTEFWAGRGFVVLQPTHIESRSLGPMSAERRPPNLSASRIQDVTFLIDSLRAVEQAIPALKGRIDARRLVVAGHSAGARTAQLLAGAETYGADAMPQSWRDPRIQAAILLAPQGLGRDLNTHSWDRMNLPFLVVTGSEDRTPPQGSPPDWQAEPFLRAPPGQKYWLRIAGAAHEMGDIYGDGEIPPADQRPEMVQMVREITGAFLDSVVWRRRAASLRLEAPTIKIGSSVGDLRHG